MAARDNGALYRAFGNSLQDNPGYVDPNQGTLNNIRDYFQAYQNVRGLSPEEQSAGQNWIGPNQFQDANGWTYIAQPYQHGTAGRDLFYAYSPGEIERARATGDRAKAGAYDANTGEYLYEQEMTSKADSARGLKLGLLAVSGMMAAGAAGALGGAAGAGGSSGTAAMGAGAEGLGTGAGLGGSSMAGQTAAAQGFGGMGGFGGSTAINGFGSTALGGQMGATFGSGLGGLSAAEAGLAAAAAGGGAAAGAAGGAAGGGAAGGGGGAAAKGGILGTGMSAGDMLGAASTVAGAIGGAQGQKQGQTTTQKMDPRLDPYVFGANGQPGLLGHANSLLNRQMSQGYLDQADHFRNVGMGLLNTPVRGNGFDYFMGRK